MFNDIDWTKSGNYPECILNAREVSDHAKKFQQGHRSFLGPGDEEKWYGTCIYKPDGKWDQQANQMTALFAQSGHPVFRGVQGVAADWIFFDFYLRVFGARRALVA